MIFPLGRRVPDWCVPSMTGMDPWTRGQQLPRVTARAAAAQFMMNVRPAPCCDGKFEPAAPPVPSLRTSSIVSPVYILSRKYRGCYSIRVHFVQKTYHLREEELQKIIGQGRFIQEVRNASSRHPFHVTAVNTLWKQKNYNLGYDFVFWRPWIF